MVRSMELYRYTGRKSQIASTNAMEKSLVFKLNPQTLPAAAKSGATVTTSTLEGTASWVYRKLKSGRKFRYPLDNRDGFMFQLNS